MATHSIVDLVTEINTKFARKTAVADVVDTIENIAPIESSPSTSAYAVGDQLIFNKVLYNVTTAISIGDALAVGTNIALADTVTEQITDKENAPVELSATLAIGATTLTFTNAAITNTAKIDVYTDTYTVSPTDITQSGTTLTLTFKAQSAAVAVKVLIRG